MLGDTIGAILSGDLGRLLGSAESVEIDPGNRGGFCFDTSWIPGERHDATVHGHAHVVVARHGLDRRALGVGQGRGRPSRLKPRLGGGVYEPAVDVDRVHDPDR